MSAYYGDATRIRRDVTAAILRFAALLEEQLQAEADDYEKLMADAEAQDLDRAIRERLAGASVAMDAAVGAVRRACERFKAEP